MTNLILASDSYKHSHFLQYPPEARVISAYGEAVRTTFAGEVLFLGLQPYLIDYLGRPVTAADIDEAEAICAAHGVPFNAPGGRRSSPTTAATCRSRSPRCPEGTMVPTGVPLFQLANTDERMPWLTTFVETALLRAVWYPTTVGHAEPQVQDG
jgi:nicotinamide phosphoribosyltransferase